MNWINCTPAKRVSNDVYKIFDLDFGDGVFSVTTLHPGQHTKGHSHPYSEVYYFLADALAILGSEYHYVSKNDVLLVNPSVFHQVHNLGGGDINFLCMWGKSNGT